MAKTDLTIDVEARITVSNEMADRCLALLEMWQKDHREQRIMATERADGSIHLYRERKEPSPNTLKDLGNGMFEKVYNAPLKAEQE